MATFAVGDVHGMLTEFHALLDRAKVRLGQDRIILVGDLVGRGPDSLGVLRAVSDMGERTQVVLGNHDLHLLRAQSQGQVAGNNMSEVQEAHDADQLCDWLRGRPLAIGLPGQDVIVVHAGLWPTWDVETALRLSDEVHGFFVGDHHKEALELMYGNDETSWDDRLSAGSRLQAIVNIMTRMRACRDGWSIDWRYQGRPGEQLRQGSIPWFDIPQRSLKETLIVCGHWSTLGLFVRKDIAMIDTGCCFGQPLTGLWIEDRRLVFSR